MDDPDAPSVTSPRTTAQHLADEVRRRRSALGLTQDQIAARGNIPQRTFAAVETAKRHSYRATTLAGLDRGLDWEPGTAARILHTEGWRPDEPDHPVVDAIERQSAILERLVGAVQDLHRPPTLTEQLADIWEALSEEDRAHIQQLALRLRNTHSQPRPNDGTGAGD